MFDPSANPDSCELGVVELDCRLTFFWNATRMETNASGQSSSSSILYKPERLTASGVGELSGNTISVVLSRAESHTDSLEELSAIFRTLGKRKRAKTLPTMHRSKMPRQCDFWWGQLVTDRSLKCASYRGGQGERSCLRSATAIHSVAMGRTPSLPTGRRSLYHSAIVALALMEIMITYWNRAGDSILSRNLWICGKEPLARACHCISKSQWECRFVLVTSCSCGLWLQVSLLLEWRSCSVIEGQAASTNQMMWNGWHSLGGHRRRAIAVRSAIQLNRGASHKYSVSWD